MEKKRPILSLLTIIFGGAGIVTALITVLGSCLLMDDAIWRIVWGAFSGALLLTAFILWIVDRCIHKKKKKIQDMLISRNLYVMAQITEVDINEHYIISRNNIDMYPFQIHCKFTGMDGTEYTFHSDKLLYNPAGLLRDNQIKVYVDLRNPKLYWVDITSVLPERVVLHKFKIGYGAHRLKDSADYIMAKTCGVELQGYRLRTGAGNTGAHIIEKGDEPFDMLHMPVDGKGRRYAGFWVLCQFETPDHVTHIFASRGRFGVPKKDFVGDDIKVYVRGQSFKEYFVDSDRITELNNR